MILKKPDDLVLKKNDALTLKRVDVLENDKDISLPHLFVLKASAGAGKTYVLSKRFVQFILSEKIPHNNIRNILAVTFTNNAAQEMKERILEWLKLLYFQDPESLKEFSNLLTLSSQEITKKAEVLIEEILSSYSDFQIKTIDSFMTAIFKFSALDFGYNPEFDVLLNNDYLMGYAFNLFLKNVRKGTKESHFFQEIINTLHEYKKGDQPYLWDPSNNILEEIKKIHIKLAAFWKKLKINDYSTEKLHLENKAKDTCLQIEDMMLQSGLDRNKNSRYNSVYKAITEGRYSDIVGKSGKTPPVKNTKHKQNTLIKQDVLVEYYNKIKDKWEELCEVIDRYTYISAYSYYVPYLKVYEEFSEIIEKIKKEQGKIFIEDISKNLALYLGEKTVPDIYCRIGETIFHYFIDEFQDTSPIQWQNLFPLLENSLSQKGSVFIVGDTKQAIYGFRNADYTIMKDLEHNNPFSSAKQIPSAKHVFFAEDIPSEKDIYSTRHTSSENHIPSASHIHSIDHIPLVSHLPLVSHIPYVKHIVGELEVNYRSKQAILDFTEKVFKEMVADSQELSDTGKRSGLTDYAQKVKEENKEAGYVEVVFCDKNDESLPEQQKVKEIVQELCKRGYSYKDIAILTQKNENVVRVTSWLNEFDIPFVSYSNLDIRRRKITCEIIDLLKFLDSPVNDFSFAAFILGNIFQKTISKYNPEADMKKIREFLFTHRDYPNIYKFFQKEYNNIWNIYFETLFNASGYMPLYDLITETYNIFKLFETFNEEEAALVKILEVVKEFEGEGYNSIKGFLDFAGHDESDERRWNINLPKDVNAVNVMTIHKAKGLEFPVAILILYNDESKKLKYIIKENKEEINLLKITKEIAGCNKELEDIYDEEEIKKTVNTLNTLYVGFTRAREELYVIGVRNRKRSSSAGVLTSSIEIETEKDSFPLNIIPADNLFSCYGKPEKTVCKQIDSLKKTTDSLEKFPINHPGKSIKLFSQNTQSINIEERLRGEFIHKVLSFIDFFQDKFNENLIQVIRKTKDETGMEYLEEDVKNIITNLLQQKEIFEYFIKKPDREVKMEQEFCDKDGNLFRMDRVVIDKNKVIVIDYKTGMDRETPGKHKEQIETYMKILKDIYPDKDIEGLLAYVDSSSFFKTKFSK